MEDLDYSLQEFRKAGNSYPFNFTLRSASAMRLGNYGLNYNSNVKLTIYYAEMELKRALESDPYSPELLVLMIYMNMKLNRPDVMRHYFETFRQVDRKSYSTYFKVN